MNEEIKPFDAVDVPLGQTSPVGRGGFGGMVDGFTDWYDKLDDTKRRSLSSGLMTAGLSMMELGGKSYDRPVSGLSVMGAAGKQGVASAQNTLDRERSDIARNKGLALQDSYVSLARNREDREAKAFDATSPYLEQQAKDKTALGGLQVDVTKSEINKNNAMAGIKGMEHLDEQQKVKFNQASETIGLITKQLGMNLGGASMTGDWRQMLQAARDNPAQMDKINTELGKPENARAKKAWDNAWSYIYDAMGDESATNNLDISPEEKKQIYKETWGLAKSGADKAFNAGGSAVKSSWEDYDH